MLRKLIAAACFALLAFAAVPSNAQQAIAITSCGSPPNTLSLNDPHVLYMDTTGVLCTTAGGGGSASSPFTPNGNYQTLTSTASSSASTALPAGATVAFQNTSTVDVSCVLASGAATATTNKIVVRGGATVFVAVGSNVNTACINQTGSASNVVVLAGGTGLGTNFGGGSGGGGGGAATIADGADVAEGATTDAVVAAGAAGSVSAKLRRLTTDLAALNTLAGSATPSGTNDIGDVGQAFRNAKLTYTPVNFNTSGDNTLVTRSTGTLKIHGVDIVCASSVAFNPTNGAAGTSYTGGARTITTWFFPINSEPYYTTTGTNAFVVNLGSAVVCRGGIWSRES